MKTAFGIFWRDVKLLLRNPVALLVVGALLVLPGLYAWYCIVANWDPYANTGNAPIAVVNEDEGAESDLAGSVNIGAQVVEGLRDNDSIDWRFYDDEGEALEATRLGECYATIVFPEDLSANVVGIFTGSHAEPIIYYHPNQKFNAVAVKVADSAVLALTRQVNQEFAATVNQVVLAKVQQGADGVEQAADGAQASAIAQVAQAQGDIAGVLTSLDDASSSIAGWRSAVSGGQEALSGTAAQLPAIRDGLSTASGDISTLRTEVDEFSSGFNDALLNANSRLSRLSVSATSRVSSVSASIEEVAGSAKGVVQELRGFRGTLDEVAEAVGGLSEDLQAQLLESIAELDATMGELETAAGNVSDAAQLASSGAADLDGTVQGVTGSASEISTTFSTSILPKLSSGTDSLARSTSGLSQAVAQFEPQVTQLQDVLSKTDDALVKADAAIAQAKDLLSNVSVNLQATVADLGAMGSALEVEKVSQLLEMNPDNVGEFISSPVHLVTEEVYPVSNYGTAVAPFYTNLALWIGCFILISIIRLEVDRRGFERATSTQRYFGRWLLLVILALLQSQTICGVDLLLGIDCANPAAFMVSGAIASFCYMNLIYALVITFRNLGKTLCILLLIMQVPGSSGMYPIEMMPGFFQAIHPFLPFTYGIDAMREALCGMYGNTMLGDMLVLSSLVPASLLLGLAIRPASLNLTRMFDEEMEKTGFFAGEEHGQGGDTEGIRAMMRALSRSDEYRDDVERRAWRFKRLYPKLRKGGSRALFAIPFAFLAIMLPFNLTMEMEVDVKLVSLVVVLMALLAVAVALVVLEYTHRSIIQETRLLGEDILGDLSPFVESDEAAPSPVGLQAGDAAGETPALVEEVRHSAPAHAREGEQVQAAAPEAALSAKKGPKHAKRGIRSKRAKDTRRRFGALREIFRTDMKLGFQSVIGAVAIMLLVITPSLYAWFNIAGSWDPYSHTDGLKVAVANDDEGYKGELIPLTVNIGDSVVSQLRGNSSFDWQFVSHEEALAGIEAGDYYASIVIPEDFSRNMLTYLTDDADYPDVRYYTNEKENPIAPLITQKGAASIQENIRATFTERVDEVGLGLAADVMEYLAQPEVGNYATKMGAHLDEAMRDMGEGSSAMRSVADLASLTSGVIDTAGAAMDGVLSAAATGKTAVGEAEEGLLGARDAFAEAEGLIEQVVSQNSGSLAQVADDADGALAGMEPVVSEMPGKLRAASEKLEGLAEVMDSMASSLDKVIEDESLPSEERKSVQAVQKRIEAIADGLWQIEAELDGAADDADGGAGRIAQARSDIQQFLADAQAGIYDARAFYDEGVRGSAESLEGTMRSVADSTRSIVGGLEEVLSGLSSSTSGLSSQLASLSGGLVNAADQLDSIAADVDGAKARVTEALSSGDMQKMVALLLGNDTEVLASRLATPVAQQEEAMFPVANYGSNMAPFYTVLSLWVGALVMVSTMKVHLTPERSEELRRRFRLKPRHEYLGRFGIFSIVGALQALLVGLGDICLLHIQCLHPVLFVLECVFIGQVFCLIVYTLSELFGDIGKAVCIILLIMQVAASGGTFPIEMLDTLFFQVAPYLPFYHGMTALQGCVAGIYQADTFWYLAFLLVYVVAMFLVGVVARRPFRYVTDWVEGQLEKTGYM